jgi:hypothetical protein
VITKQLGENVFDLATMDNVYAGRRHADALRPYFEQPSWCKKLEGDVEEGEKVDSGSVEFEGIFEVPPSRNLRPRHAICKPRRLMY